MTESGSDSGRRRPVFFVSDRTGITAETLGHTLLTQFPSVEYELLSLPFVNSPEQAMTALETIGNAARSSGQRPLVFSTIIDSDIKAVIEQSHALVIDFFDTFTPVLERELETASSPTSGLSHGISNESRYMSRMEAINFALLNDDGVTTRNYDKADIVLIGASRCGKTPTCLYLAMQYGLGAANYPLADDDIQRQTLPGVLLPYRSKLFGLTISPERLHNIRQLRRPNSNYASLVQCQKEVRAIRAVYEHEGIAFIDTSQASVEEIAAMIMQKQQLSQRMYL